MAQPPEGLIRWLVSVAFGNVWSPEFHRLRGASEAQWLANTRRPSRQPPLRRLVEIDRPVPLDDVFKAWRGRGDRKTYKDAKAMLAVNTIPRRTCSNI